MLRSLVKKDSIIEPLSKVQTIVDKKSTMQVLNNVLLHCRDDKMVIEATDLEISYMGIVDADIQEDGEVLINARKFYDVVREIPVDEFLLEELPGNWIRIAMGKKGEYKFGAQSPEKFPRFKFIESEGEISIQSKALKDMISKTVVAVAHDESKYTLTGLLLEIDPDENTMKAVGSDSHRLNMITVPAPECTIQDFSVIIPRKGALEILKLLQNEMIVSLKTDEKFFLMQTDRENLLIRCVDGRFPDYTSILPTEQLNCAVIDRVEILKSLKRLSIFSNDPEVKSVKMTFLPGELLVESMATDSSNAEERLDVDYTGEGFTVGLNARYMIDTLSVMQSSQITFCFNDEDSPCTLGGPEDPGFTGLVMPIALEEAEGMEEDSLNQ